MQTMFRSFLQVTLLTTIVILIQTTKHIHCDPSSDTDESNVLSLTKDTFDDAVKNNQYLLVKFVAPWCGHCKSLTPAYAAAAKQLADAGSEVRLASVDATIDRDLAEQYGVRGYPTLKFFKNGVAVDYTGGRAQEEIINWLNKKTGPSAQELTTVEQLNNLKEANEVVVIGAFQNTNGDAAVAFLQVAKTMDDTSFSITSNKDVLKELNVNTDTVVLLKKFDEGRNDLTSSFDEKSIREFIQKNQVPLVIPFNPKTAQKIFNGDIKIHVLLFGSAQDANYKNIQEEFQTAAKSYRGKTLFVFVDADEDENQRVIDYFGVQKTDLPSIRLITLKDHITKYKPDSTDITSSVLQTFVDSFFDGKLQPHLLSQEVPEDWDKNPVTVLVGKNFQDVARDQSKTVLVAFIAPWCGHCKQLTPIYEQLGEKYKDNSDVLVAKIDSTTNELADIQIESFPTIKLFPKGSDEVVDYAGARTFEALAKFIDTNGKENGKTGAGADEDEEQVPTEGDDLQEDEPVGQGEDFDGEDEEPLHEDL